MQRSLFSMLFVAVTAGWAPGPDSEVGQSVTIRAEESDPLNFMVPGYPVGGLGWWLVVTMAAVGVVVGLTGVKAWCMWTRTPTWK